MPNWILWPGNKKEYITLDWDDISFREAMDRCMKIFNSLPATEIYYRESSSQTGWHIRVEFDYDRTEVERLELREQLWDDPVRIAYDRARIKEEAIVDYSKGVLFDKNGDMYAGKWEKYGP